MCVQVQRELGIKQAVSFDLTAACSGFVVALITASQFIQSGSRKNILVIGADALSRYVDWNDRGEPFHPLNILPCHSRLAFMRSQEQQILSERLAQISDRILDGAICECR